jgi:hypothetical protein
MFGLVSLPYEVLSNIVGNINFDDVWSLGQTCKELSFLLREESICKLIVQVSTAQNIVMRPILYSQIQFSAADSTSRKKYDTPMKPLQQRQVVVAIPVQSGGVQNDVKH